MERLTQTVDEIVNNLSPLVTEWADETSLAAMAAMDALPIKDNYTTDDVARLLDSKFVIGLLIIRLFLGLSDDEMETNLKDILGTGGTGIKRFTAERQAYLDALLAMGILDAMADMVNRPLAWSDTLVERLRSGRGKAVKGQRRGRNLEDFVEGIVQSVFGVGNYEMRCQFSGPNGETAKCDFAIPTKSNARILIEVKGYGATGSKMTDVLGDLNIIVNQKRHDTTLILFTDGVTWKRRLSDLGKIIALQNSGKIARVYTSLMEDGLRRDLETLKAEYGI